MSWCVSYMAYKRMHCLLSLEVIPSPEGDFAQLFILQHRQRVVWGLVWARRALITNHAGVCMKAWQYQVMNFSAGPPKLTAFLWRRQRTRPYRRDKPQRPKAAATTSAESYRGERPPRASSTSLEPGEGGTDTTRHHPEAAAVPSLAAPACAALG